MKKKLKINPSVQNLKKGMKSSHDLFWPDLPKFHLPVDHEAALLKD